MIGKAEAPGAFCRKGCHLPVCIAVAVQPMPWEPWMPNPSPPPPNCSVKEGANKEVLGILVSYRVKVKLVVSRGG